MYKAVKVHIPQELHEKLKSLVAQDKVMPVKIDLRGGDDIILLTPGQIIKMEQAKNNGKKINHFSFQSKTSASECSSRGWIS